MPRPRGVPVRTPFLVGAVGHFSAAAMSLVVGIGMLLAEAGYPFFFATSVLGYVLGVVFFVAMLLQLIGFYGFWRNYGSGMGGAAFAYGLAVAIFFLVAMALASLAIRVDCGFGYCYVARVETWGFILIIASLVTLGVSFILEGVSFIVVRRFTSMPGASVAAGVLFIIGGSFVTSILLAIFGGFFVLVPAFILGGIVLVKAPPAGGLRPRGKNPSYRERGADSRASVEARLRVHRDQIVWRLVGDYSGMITVESVGVRENPEGRVAATRMVSPDSGTGRHLIFRLRRVGGLLRKAQPAPLQLRGLRDVNASIEALLSITENGPGTDWELGPP